MSLLISKYVFLQLVCLLPYGSGSEKSEIKKANQKAFSIKQKLSIILLSSVHFILSLSRKTE